MNFRDLGIFNNRGFLHHYIAENPLTATVKFASINRWPIIEPFNHLDLLNLCYIYSVIYTVRHVTRIHK